MLLLSPFRFVRQLPKPQLLSSGFRLLSSLTMNPHLNLGYCCLNTVLREDDKFCSRTMRLITFRTKGLEYAKELALKNLQDMLPILEWNEANGMNLFRVSSDIFPLASHPECLYSLEFAQPLLTQIGDLARKYGHRLTMHPSQHHVLTNKAEKTFHHTALGEL